MYAYGDVLSSVYTDSSLKHAIEVLDADESQQVTSRNVRSAAERRCLDEAAQILAQMRPLALNLQSLGRAARKEAKVFNEMSQILARTESSVGVYAEEAQFLAEEQQKGDAQQATLKVFMDKVYLSPREKEVLDDANSVLTPEFFAAFTRARDIHREAAPVILSEAPRAGEQLMHETAQLLDNAYLKIRGAIELELKRRASGASSTASTNSIALREYMMLLADRPLLFKAVLENQSGARKTKLSKDFAAFLAKEQSTAHIMPVQFMSSVLAWIHANVVNELEHISLLLDPGQDTAANDLGSALLSSLLSTSNPHQIVSELVDQVVGSLEPTIRQHLHALIVAQTDPSVVDEMQGLLLFYQNVVLAKYEQPKLDQMFTHLSQILASQFTRLLPADWDSRVGLALDLLKTHEQGLYNDPEIFQQRFDAVLDNALEEELNAAPDPIASLNVLDTAISQLAGYVAAQPKLESYRQLENKFIAKQVSTEAALISNESKLTEFQVNAISLREFMAALDAFLSQGGGQDLVTRLDKLNSPTTAHQIATAAIDEFVSQYEFATRDANARPVEEVRALLV